VSGSQRRAVFSIPKTLCCYFLYDLKLFADLSRCTCESLNVFLQKTIPENNPIPGAVTPKQTFGDFLGFNPHAQILATDGCFYGNKEMIRVDTPLELKKLVARDASFKGKMTKAVIWFLSTTYGLNSATKSIRLSPLTPI
jgi:hypothetical protein